MSRRHVAKEHDLRASLVPSPLGETLRAAPPASRFQPSRPAFVVLPQFVGILPYLPGRHSAMVGPSSPWRRILSSAVGSTHVA